MSRYETVVYALEDRVARITLNRPDVRNAIDATVRRELLAALQQAEADAEVRVILLAAAGASFGAGHDLSGADAIAPADTRQFIETQYWPVFKAIRGSNKIVLAAVQGTCAGVSVALALSCDLVVMANDACFYQVFTAIGLVPDGGISWLLGNSMGSKRAFENLVSSRKLLAAEALTFGLVNRLAAPDQLLDEAVAWARELSEGAPLAQCYTKRALHYAMNNDFASTFLLEADFQNIVDKTQDFQEGLASFREKRKPHFIGK
jgi:2-(1,2-epoxy-1,2-dihydrophenyl)acetyl-CoA isomerase